MLNYLMAMRILFTIGVTLSCGLINQCAAQSATQLPGSDYKSIIRFGESDATASSRFGSSIVVSVNVNGSVVELALDTGSNYSLIAAPRAEKLDLKRVTGNGLCPQCSSAS